MSEDLCQTNDIYVHIQRHPTTVPLVKLKRLLAVDWARGALAAHTFIATYHDKDDEEYEWQKRATKLIENRCPSKYKHGMHLLAARGGFMGENVFVVDGVIQDTIHHSHAACGKDMLLWRRKYSELWCAHCYVMVPKEEVFDRQIPEDAVNE